MNTNQDKVLRTHVKRMALSLSVLCHIQQGEELVMIIGSGHESSNQEALEFWVSQQMKIDEVISTNKLLKKLQNQLMDEIQSWSSYY